MKERKTNKMSEFSFTLQNGSKFIPWVELSQFKGSGRRCVKMEKKRTKYPVKRVSGRKMIVASVSRFLK